jgi:hypothetical protein
MKPTYQNNMKKFTITILTFICLLVFHYADAQAPDTSRKYKVFLEPYLLIANMAGTTGVGNLPNTYVSVPASKVFSSLQFGAMLYAEVHNNQFAFTTDLLYASLSQSASGKNGVLNGTVAVKQFWWELEGLYKLTPWFEAGVGTRLNNVKTDLNINVITPSKLVNQTNEGTNTWVDPLIVTRLKTWVAPKWLLSFRADIGGFGIGSSFAWQLQPDVAYRASRLLQIGLGYRYISMDYNNNKSGSDRFLYNMNEYGPQIRIGFNF